MDQLMSWVFGLPFGFALAIVLIPLGTLASTTAIISAIWLLDKGAGRLSRMVKKRG